MKKSKPRNQIVGGGAKSLGGGAFVDGGKKMEHDQSPLAQ